MYPQGAIWGHDFRNLLQKFIAKCKRVQKLMIPLGLSFNLLSVHAQITSIVYLTTDFSYYRIWAGYLIIAFHFSEHQEQFLPQCSKLLQTWHAKSQCVSKHYHLQQPCRSIHTASSQPKLWKSHDCTNLLRICDLHTNIHWGTTEPEKDKHVHSRLRFNHSIHTQ